MRGDSLHIHHPHGESDRVTDTQPQYDGTHPQVLVLTTIEEQDTQQDAHSYPNITQATERTVIHSRIPPAASDHSYLDQAQADEQHHDTRYQGVITERRYLKVRLTIISTGEAAIQRRK